MGATQMWGVCSDASGPDESSHGQVYWAAAKQILLDLPLIEALTFKVKIFSGLMSDLMDRNTLKAALCNHCHDSTQRSSKAACCPKIGELNHLADFSRQPCKIFFFK